MSLLRPGVTKQHEPNQTIQIKILQGHMIQICSGITRGRVLNGELYAQILQKLIYLNLSTECFMKIGVYRKMQIN